ncbi:MAG: acyl carrier protein [Kiritimatiellaeota bacterium]|nr:acyl carrier protein [Kiritimatiellota bacterium]
MATIQEALKELIVDRLFLDIEPSEIDTDTPLAEYGVDSFLLLELIVALEELYDIKFEESDITAETLKSVASLTELIQTKQGGSG